MQVYDDNGLLLATVEEDQEFRRVDRELRIETAGVRVVMSYNEVRRAMDAFERSETQLALAI